MADYHQVGSVATLHNIAGVTLDYLESHLREYCKTRKVTLILPSLFSELETDALAGIVEELKGADYVNHIIIGLDRASEEEFKFAKDYFSVLPQKHDILWNDGPRLNALHQQLAETGLAPEEPGKGRNVWYCIGYALANRNSDIVALHDCDIITYKRELLARLIYPLANPAFPYQFCKGYYPRIADGKLNGRANRLLVAPLLRTMQKVIGHNDYIEYLQSFKYPLAGEFAMRTSILPNMRIPSDWGLEIGVLSEVWRNLSNSNVCQVDIADVYDHKHQQLSKEDSQSGLSRMSIDITKALFRKLATDGVVFGGGIFRTIKATYYRTALDMVEMYHHDAIMNGLYTDRHQEEEAVELFAANIIEAGQVFAESPHDSPFIPSWSRVQSAEPDLLRHMLEAVAADKADV